MPYGIDRGVLRDIVFKDKTAMTKLENILWPKIREMIIEAINIEREKEKARKVRYAKYKDVRDKSGVKVVIVEAAVLVKAKWVDIFDKIIQVATDREIARERLMKRNKIEFSDADRRLNAQNDFQEKIDLIADHTILNNGTEEELKVKIVDVYSRLVDKKPL